jgi:hypothetical protein
MPLPPELQQLDDAYAAIERDALNLVAGLSEDSGRWRGHPDTWSIAECLDHLAVGNRIYLDAMRSAAIRARAAGRLRSRAALPGFVGRIFVSYMEPPVKRKLKAPGRIRPRTSPPLAQTATSLLESHRAFRAFLQEYAHLDLARIRFVNPFIPVIRFSLATGLHVIAAHDRRHLWQAWQVRRMAGIPANSPAESQPSAPGGTR